MEQLGVLEKKLVSLIESKKQDVQRIADLTAQVDQLKEEKALLNGQLTQEKESGLRLYEENTSLRTQVEKLEDALLVRHQSVEGLNQERELTKMAVDDLIKSIDILIEAEQ